MYIVLKENQQLKRAPLFANYLVQCHHRYFEKECVTMKIKMQYKDLKKTAHADTRTSW